MPCCQPMPGISFGNRVRRKRSARSVRTSSGTLTTNGARAVTSGMLPKTAEFRGSHHEGPLGLIESCDIRDVYPHLRDSEVIGGQALKVGDAQAHWELCTDQLIYSC